MLLCLSERSYFVRSAGRSCLWSWICMSAAVDRVKHPPGLPRKSTRCADQCLRGYFCLLEVGNTLISDNFPCLADTVQKETFYLSYVKCLKYWSTRCSNANKYVHCIHNCSTFQHVTQHSCELVMHIFHRLTCTYLNCRQRVYSTGGDRAFLLSHGCRMCSPLSQKRLFTLVAINHTL